MQSIYPDAKVEGMLALYLCDKAVRCDFSWLEAHFAIFLDYIVQSNGALEENPMIRLNRRVDCVSYLLLAFEKFLLFSPSLTPRLGLDECIKCSHTSRQGWDLQVVVFVT